MYVVVVAVVLVLLLPGWRFAVYLLLFFPRLLWFAVPCIVYGIALSCRDSIQTTTTRAMDLIDCCSLKVPSFACAGSSLPVLAPAYAAELCAGCCIL